MKDFSFINKRDGILLVILLALGIGGWLLQKNLSVGSYAEISVDGDVVKTVLLSKEDTFEVGNMLFEVKDGGIRAIHSPCHDQICVHTGRITNAAQTIVCLPEKTAVRIVGEKYENGADLTIG